MGILIIPIFLILMYVALLRPQQQRVRRQQQLVTSIGAGDEVVTAGGVIGRVVGLTDAERLQLEVADGVVIEVLRLAISRRLDPAEDATDGSATGSTPGSTSGSTSGTEDEIGGGAGETHDYDRAAHDETVHLPPDADSR